MISRYKQSRNEPHEGQHPFAESTRKPPEKAASTTKEAEKTLQPSKTISRKESYPKPRKTPLRSAHRPMRGGGEILKYKYTYTYTRTTCVTHAASDRNAADVIRPGIRQQQKSGSSNTFAISLNRFICTKFFLSVPQI